MYVHPNIVNVRVLAKTHCHTKPQIDVNELVRGFEQHRLVFCLESELKLSIAAAHIEYSALTAFTQGVSDSKRGRA